MKTQLELLRTLLCTPITPWVPENGPCQVGNFSEICLALVTSMRDHLYCGSHCPSEGSWPPVRTDIKLYEWILRIFGAGGRYILELWDETCRKRAPGFVLSISNVYATFCVHMNKRGLGQDAKTCSKARWYPIADLLDNTAFSTKFRWKIKKKSKIHLKNMKKKRFSILFLFFRNLWVFLILENRTAASYRIGKRVCPALTLKNNL